jgi:hypothetical protein
LLRQYAEIAENIIRQLVTKLESSELRVRAQVMVNPMAT